MSEFVTYKPHPKFKHYLCGSDGTLFSIARGKQYLHVKGFKDHRGYRRVSMGKKNLAKYLHVLVAEAHLQRPDGNYQVNHIDHNTANNNILNLEFVTPFENKSKYAARMNKDGTWGYGFCKERLRWRAFLSICGNGKKKRKYLGQFLKKEDAIKAFREGYKKHHGFYPY